MGRILRNIKHILLSVFKHPLRATSFPTTRNFDPEDMEVSSGQSYSFRENQQHIEVSQGYKLFFWVALILTVLSLAIAFVLAYQSQPLSPQQNSLFETCTTTWKMGFGAIIGLIGGKAVN
jgi:hypothetical protein